MLLLQRRVENYKRQVTRLPVFISGTFIVGQVSKYPKIGGGLVVPPRFDNRQSGSDERGVQGNGAEKTENICISHHIAPFLAGPLSVVDEIRRRSRRAISAIRTKEKREDAVRSSDVLFNAFESAGFGKIPHAAPPWASQVKA